MRVDISAGKFEWEGCYLTERAETVLTVVTPGTLNCTLGRTVQRIPHISDGTTSSTTIGAFIHGTLALMACRISRLPHEEFGAQAADQT